MSNFRIDDVIPGPPYKWQEPQVGRLKSRESNLRPEPIYNDDEQEFTLSTGTKFWAYTDVLGLGSDGRLGYGSDGPVDIPLTPAERREIADMMIARWGRWKEGR